LRLDGRESDVRTFRESLRAGGAGDPGGGSRFPPSDTLVSNTRAIYSGDDGGSTAIGFVLIGTLPKREKEVYEQLLKIKEVVELYPLFGDYDLIAKVEAPDYNLIGEIVVSKIRAIDGVRATKTLARMSF